MSECENTSFELGMDGAAVAQGSTGEMKAEFRPTPTARNIVAFLSEREDVPMTKSAIAEQLGRCEKTVDRLIAKLRDNGYVTVEEHWNENGAQLPNTYRVLRKV